MNLPRAWRQTPPLSGLLRQQPEDFVVEEIPAILPEGEGEHLWLRIRKCGQNTAHVARVLARLAGVPPRDVGYAGLKDRHAVTTQWFSLPDPKRRLDLAQGLIEEGIEVLEVARHGRKLRRGVLAGNRFRIRLRAWQGDPDAARQLCDEIATAGVPNYFGEQRFGREGGNVARAEAMFRRELRPRGRSERGILLSSARSMLFNEVLAERVRRGDWNRILPGEAVVLDGSGSFFTVETDEEIAAAEARGRRGDCHPSGPLWGRGRLPSRGEAAELERTVAARHPVLCDGLEHAGLRQERRSLRLLPQDLSLDTLDGVIEFSFMLPPGTYATVLLRELADYRNAAG
ncbi:MAG: tRNA pseudouridine(13) synthase TruD [Gammaproteobacteria bacterium]|nr:MAG: tRNA pseudouridine(13) synthase TruD [Gammaproteobacteria bacterium]